jgi:three-Cys-motif partner protein
MGTKIQFSADHEFGSSATELKLSLVEAYSKAFTTALRAKFAQLWYIDAFAGTGERTERLPAVTRGFFARPEKVIRHRGSARIAIDVNPPFDRMIFIEKRRKAVEALEQLRDQHQERAIDVIEGDANVKIRRLVRQVDWRNKRAVMFLDPYGMSVDWLTLSAVAETRAIDVWYLFSISGLYRQAARDAADIDKNKRAAITRVLGTDKWEEMLYARRKGGGFFPPETDTIVRQADVRDLETYVRDRLKTIFPEVLAPFALPRQGPQLFSLFFAVSNNSPAALKLASKIADYILKVGMSSHTRSR